MIKFNNINTVKETIKVLKSSIETLQPLGNSYKSQVRRLKKLAVQYQDQFNKLYKDTEEFKQMRGDILNIFTSNLMNYDELLDCLESMPQYTELDYLLIMDCLSIHLEALILQGKVREYVRNDIKLYCLA